jgi:hypothetical protein
MPGVGLNGGHRKTSIAMINRRKKSHRAENLISWPYSTKFAATTAPHHTTMMYQSADAKKRPIWRGGCHGNSSEASHHG